ncbi:MAG: hypothetical protein ACRDRH_01990 [Pseudonocardia sp.]
MLGEHTLGLLDDDAGIERSLELLAEHHTASDRPFLQDADRRHIGQRLRQQDVGLG